MKKQNVKTKIIVVAIVCLAVVASFFVTAKYLIHEKNINIEHCNFIADTEANRIQYAIDSRLLNLEILEMLVIENDGMIDNFEEIAEMLYEQDNCIRCIQLAPNGVITKIYPLEGNENGFGNLFLNPLRRSEAIYARDSGEMTLGGPYELHQGGIGVVARRPIYLEDNDGNKEFWGFSIQVMDLEALLDSAQLFNLDREGYDYQLWRIMPDTKIKQVFEGKDNISESAISYSIKVPGNEWHLEVMPKKGWVSTEKIVLSILLAIFVDVLITIIAYYVVSSEEKKFKLKNIIKTDTLTGIYSSSHFFTTLKEAIEEKTPFTLFYLDLDKFKYVNDNYGHNIGDKLLVEIGQRITLVIGDVGKAFRIGGDEFSVILYGDNKDDVCNEIKKRIEEACSEPIVIDDVSLEITASAGFARYPKDKDNIEELFNHADKRMYTDKVKKKQEAVNLDKCEDLRLSDTCGNNKSAISP